MTDDGDKKREEEDGDGEIATALTTLPIDLVLVNSKARRWWFGGNEVVAVVVFQLRCRLMQRLLPSSVGLQYFR